MERQTGISISIKRTTPVPDSTGNVRGTPFGGNARETRDVDVELDADGIGPAETPRVYAALADAAERIALALGIEPHREYAIAIGRGPDVHTEQQTLGVDVPTGSATPSSTDAMPSSDDDPVLLDTLRTVILGALPEDGLPALVKARSHHARIGAHARAAEQIADAVYPWLERHRVNEHSTAAGDRLYRLLAIFDTRDGSHIADVVQAAREGYERSAPEMQESDAWADFDRLIGTVPRTAAFRFVHVHEADDCSPTGMRERNASDEHSESSVRAPRFMRYTEGQTVRVRLPMPGVNVEGDYTIDSIDEHGAITFVVPEHERNASDEHDEGRADTDTDDSEENFASISVSLSGTTGTIDDVLRSLDTALGKLVASRAPQQRRTP